MKQTKIAIIGSGPAGYTAGIYASRAMFEPILFTGIQQGGQLMWTTEIENFPGFPQGKDGKELMADMRKQAEKFGTKIVDTYVTAVDFSKRPFELWTKLPEVENPVEFYEHASSEEILQAAEKIKQQEPDYQAEAVIIASGAVARLVGVKGEKEFLGRGVSTCAVCDAAFYKERDVFVVGGGDSAMEDTLALVKFAKSVTILHRRKEFKASKIMQERVLNNPKVQVRWETELVEVLGNQTVEKIKIKNSAGQVEELQAAGVFMAIGHKPMSQIFTNQLQIDERGFLLTRMSHNKLGYELGLANQDEHGLIKFPSMTSIEGVFGAGDLVDFRYQQAVTAAGMGTQAALDAERWLESK